MHWKLIAWWIGLLLLALPIGAQEPTPEPTPNALYSGEGFSFPIPPGWTDQSTPTLAHFTNPAGTADVYALAIPADEIQAGIDAAIAGIDPTFNAPRLQSSEVPLPGGVTWTQNVYALPDGTLIVGIGRIRDGVLYVVVIRASQVVLQIETPTLNEILLGYTLAGEVSVLDRIPEYADPTTYTEQSLTIGSDEWPLPATLTLPVGEGPFPVVILVHGSGPQDRDQTIGANKPFRDLAFGLATQGIAVLRYEKRTFVYGAELTQGPTPFTLDDETTSDALAAVAALREIDTIDSDRIFVLGHSMGGTVAPRIAQQDPDIAGLIILAGSLRPFDVVLREQYTYIGQLNPGVDLSAFMRLPDQLQAIREGQDPFVVFQDDPSEAAYWASFYAYDPSATVQALDLPMLILQGERDYQVTMEDFSLWSQLVGDRENATLKSYPDLQHTFMALGDLTRLSTPADYNEVGSVSVEVVDDIAAWVLGQ
ncbi:MAG: alpha/beta fold hydrolase [Anaerolineae bacterium]|jgi:dienelactone hydrolase|nr:alpha/beta fold hydrolase [Anaerolineae bacterium]